jgi:hypothetical protein
VVALSTPLPGAYDVTPALVVVFTTHVPEQVEESGSVGSAPGLVAMAIR